jgi:hypothetical protein
VRKTRVSAAILGCLALVITLLVASARAQLPTLRPDGTPTSGGLLVLSGSLHDHSTDSDGDASSSAIAAWEYAHRDELGLDFGTLTEHADFLPFSYHDPFGGNVWRKQGLLTQKYSRDGFSWLRGFEYTSDQENHVGIIGSTQFLAGSRGTDLSMAALYHWIATQDAQARANDDEDDDAGIVVFNHPSSKGALQWDNLAFNPAVAANVAAIEIYGDQGFSPKNLAHSDAGWYWLALARGWTVGPVMDWDTHQWRVKFAQPDIGERCGDIPRTLPCQRTLVLARSATPAGIMEALRARRTTATEHPGLWATLRGPGGVWQGSTVHDTRAGMEITLTVEASSSFWPLTKVEIVGDRGIDPHDYYDGDNLACGTRGPLCVTEAHARGQVADSFLAQHQLFEASGGYALKKEQIDGPPPEATVMTVSLADHHALETIVVHVPRERSVRPDGKHFFYAIVTAGLVRAWTSPIFTDDGARYADRPGNALP